MANSRFRDYINPVVNAIDELGGSARPTEVYKHIAQALNLSDEILNEKKESGGSRYENQVDWARFYLAKAGYIDSSKRGVWSLTDKGRKVQTFTEADINQLIKDVQAQSPPRLKKTIPERIFIQDEKATLSEEESIETPHLLARSVTKMTCSILSFPCSQLVLRDCVIAYLENLVSKRLS